MDPIVSTLRRGPEVMHLVAAFVRALPDLCLGVRSAATGGDLAEAARLAHRLKGSAAGYGFPAVADVAARVERSAVAGDAQGCEQAAEALVHVSALVRSEPAS